MRSLKRIALLCAGVAFLTACDREALTSQAAQNSATSKYADISSQAAGRSDNGATSNPVGTKKSAAVQAQSQAGDGAAVQPTGGQQGVHSAPKFATSARRDIHLEFISRLPIEAVQLPVVQGIGLRYTIDPALPEGLSFDPLTHRLTGTPAQAQVRTSYTYRVAASSGQGEDVLSFDITIEDLDSKPGFEASEALDIPVLMVGQAMQAIALPEATGGNGELSYSFEPDLPEGLVFNATEHSLSGTPVEASEVSYIFKVEDADDNHEQDDISSLPLFISILPANTAPVFEVEYLDEVAQNTLQNLRVGQPAIYIELPPAVGGEGQLSYSLAPELPAGLVFDADQLTITGTPTQPSAFQVYTYKVVDVDDDTNSQDADIIFFSLEVQGGVQNLQVPAAQSMQGVDSDIGTHVAAQNVLTPCLLPDAMQNEAASPQRGVCSQHMQGPQPQFVRAALSLQQMANLNYSGYRSLSLPLPQATGGTAPYTHSLSVSPSTTRISFTASRRWLTVSMFLTFGTYTLTHTVTDSAGASVSKTFTLTKTEAISLPSVSNKTYDRRGKTITLPAVSEGGQGPFTYTLQSQHRHHRRTVADPIRYYYGALERGLSFNPTTRILTVGANLRGYWHRLKYTVTDSNGDVDVDYFYLYPKYVTDPQGYTAYAVDCTDKYGFRQTDIHSGLVFNVFSSGIEMMSLFRQAAQEWNTALSATVFRIQNLPSWSNAPVQTKWGDNISTFSNGGIRRTITGGYIAFAQSTSNSWNSWFNWAVDIVWNPSWYAWSLARPANNLGTLKHELGHALGLGHSTNSNHVMYRYGSGGNHIHRDEVNLIRCLYDRGAASNSLLSQFSNAGSAQNLQAKTGVSQGVQGGFNSINDRTIASIKLDHDVQGAQGSPQLKSGNVPAQPSGWSDNAVNGQPRCGWRPN